MAISRAVLELLVQIKDQASAGLSSIAGGLGGVATIAGGAVVAGLAAAGTAAFNFASEAQQGVNDFQASLGISADEAERLGDIAVETFKNNWGSSLSDVNQSLIATRQQMQGLAESDLAAVTQSAIALRDTFGIEVAESTNAANTLMQQFGLTSQQAFDFITKGQQEGLNTSGDFLDTIGEYSVQFAAGGASAEQFFSLLDSGLQGGVLGTDKAADAFKEFRVRIQDGSAATSAGLAQLGIDAAALSEQMASGQVTAADAFQLVLDKLNATDDANVRMQAGVALLGTQFEDLGTEGALALSLAGVKMEDLAGSTDTLNAKYDNLGSLFEGSKRQFLVALQPLGDKLLEIGNEVIPKIMPHIEVLIDRVARGLGVAFDWLNTTGIPGIKAAWIFIEPAVTELARVLSEDLPRGIERVRLGWEILKQGLADFKTGYIDPIVRGWNEVVAAVESAYNWFAQIGDKLSSIQIPDWLQGHSPPPLANWFSDIAQASQEAQTSTGFDLGGNIGALPAVPAAPGASGGITVYLTVQGSVVTERDLVETVRRELILIAQQNVTTGIV